MDNPLTPNKILRLLHYAEDKSFNLKNRLPQREQQENRMEMQESLTNRTCMQFESSSGILDLERLEGFGETGIGAMSLSKSTAFNPGEMTGRSTGTEDINARSINLGSASVHDMTHKTHEIFEDYGRHSFALENFTSNLDKQTMEVNDVMRHSIATNYSFNVKENLTADEASLVLTRAPLPVLPSARVNITDNTMDTNTNMSIGSYFKNRCPEFTKVLGKTDSPDRFVKSNNSEVSLPTPKKSNETVNAYKMDQSLDCVPVRQSKSNNEKAQIKESTFNIDHSKHMYKNYTIPEISDSSCSFDMPPVKQNVFKYPLNKVYDLPKDSSKIEQKLLQQRLFQNVNADQFTKIAHSSPFQMPTEESTASVDNENEYSLSISKIADYLGKQSNVSVTGMIQFNNQKKHTSKKQPLAELQMNVQNNKRNNEEILVTKLKDARNMETASTMNTVIDVTKLKISEEAKNFPNLVITQDLVNKNDCNDIENKNQTIRSKSPSSKSQSTLSTVQENYTSFKSNDSPQHNSKGEANLSHILSPNGQYKELDNSVDWYEVLKHKQLKPECLAKEQWVDIRAASVNGYVGACCAATMTITTLTDSWLTAIFHFDNLPNEGRDMSIELPRKPLLLSPGKTEQFTLYITSNIEISTVLSFTVHLKDAAIDGDIDQNGTLEVNFKMPMIQTLSSDGMNKVVFPHMQENTSLTKYFVIISDCPVDLQLDLSITEGDRIFTIMNVQEISKNDVSKALLDRQTTADDEQNKIGKAKGKILNKQLCRLSKGNAIRVTLKFNAPKLVDLNLSENMVTLKGALHINLIGIKANLKKVDLIGVVGSAKLEVDIPMNKLHLSNEPKTILLRNIGHVAGTWFVSVKEKNTGKINLSFRVSPQTVEMRPGGVYELVVSYAGPSDDVTEALLIMEDVTGNRTTIDITGGTEKLRTFPIKTNHLTMSWVRAGRKELNLRNSSNKKIQIRCQIFGEGFSIDLPGVESRGTYCLSFGPNDCRPLPIMFSPSSATPHAAALHLVYDKNSDFSRKVKLFGCASGESVRWSGLVTYGETALVRAIARLPITLTLYNKYSVPAFLCASVHFNLQYRCCEEGSRVEGARCVVGARRRHAVSLAVDWARVERRARVVPAGALATLTVLAGPECTRRRIIRIIRDQESGKLDTSLLPDHLAILAQDFEGQDVVSDESLKDFEETKSSLNELIESLQELTAQIDLPQDFADDNTIIICDDTVLNHHTLCE